MFFTKKNQRKRINEEGRKGRKREERGWKVKKRKEKGIDIKYGMKER